MADVRVLALIDDLRRLPAETAWVESKENNTDPNVIGKLIPALSNSARVEDRDFGYVVWGVRDGDHTVAGTRFDPDSSKRQGQSLAFRLSRRLRPDLVFSFKTIPHPEGRLVLLEVPAATTAPVEFDRTAYIRIGDATPRLAEAGATRATLFGPRRFADMTTEERLRACYQHAVLRYLSGKRMKNSTLRVRFGVDCRNAAQISQVIRRALDEQLIRVADPARPKSGDIPFRA